MYRPAISFALLLALALAGCSSSDEGRGLLGGWNRAEGTQWSARAYLGHEHCDTQDVIDLQLSGFDDAERDHRHYLRDPRGVFQTNQAVDIDPLATNIPLPRDAIDLRLRKGNAHLFLEHDGSAVYVVQDDYIERWPRFPHDYGCD
jgi:hypothetical protein